MHMDTEAGWGIRGFENDDAAAWIDGFVGEPSAERLREAIVPLEEAARAGAALGLAECHVALAAAEVVAGWCGRPAPELPPQVTAWLLGRTAAVSAPVLERTRAAVDAIQARSALRDAWEAAGELEAWSGAIEDLRQRLGFGGG